MKGFNVFWDFVKSSAREILANKSVYMKAYIALVFLGNMDTVFPLIGVGKDTNTYIFLTILTTIATFIVISQVILLQKKMRGGSGELKFFVPTFLLYNLYYSFLFFMGLLLLVLPGFYVLIFYSMVPFVAVLDDESEGSYFSTSQFLVKKDIAVVAWASIINLLLEFAALLISPIENLSVKTFANFLFSIPDAFFTLVMTMTLVKIYYYLKEV